MVFIIEQNPKFDYKEYGDTCFDLINPLDYNPTDLIGKYWDGIKLGQLRYDLDAPCYDTEIIAIHCSDVNPSEVTDTKPTKPLYYESIFEQASLELTNEMCVQSLCPETFELWEKVKSELIVTRGMFNRNETKSHE